MKRLIRSQAQQEESISGRVVIRQYEPVSDAKVLISRENKTFEYFIDASKRDVSGKSERIPITDKSTNLKVVLIRRR